MSTKDWIDSVLKLIQTVFVIVAGAIGLVEFSDFVDEQRVQNRVIVVDAWKEYVGHVKYGNDLKHGIFSNLSMYEQNRDNLDEAYCAAALGLGAANEQVVGEHLEWLETALFSANLSEQPNIVSEFFCQDAYNVWAAFGPRILDMRQRYRNAELYRRIENEVISCGKMGPEEMDAYKAQINKLLPCASG